MEELFIPNASRHDVSTFNILVNDVALNPSYQVLSLTIVLEINRIPMVKLVIRDGDASKKGFEISDTEELAPGKKIKIKIGFDGTNTQVFKGVVVKHAVKIKGNGNSELHIECFDEAVRMTIGRHSQYFENMKDSQVFDELVGKYRSNGLSCDAQVTSSLHKELVQHHIADWDFLVLRAEANGMLVNVEGGAIKIFKPNTSADPVLQVTYGSSILEFEAEMDARNQFKTVESKSWDFNNQQLFTAAADSVPGFTESGNISGATLAAILGPAKYELNHSGHVLEQELQNWADGLLLRSRIAKIRGRAKVTGFSGVKPGDMVKLEGVGQRFKGKALVTAVRHELGAGMWDTHIQFGLDPKPFASQYKDIDASASAGLSGGIRGLQIGIVVRLENDPDSQDRILVRLPVIDNTAQGIWTRMASLDAGSDRGAFFRPEIGDEVIVGFINDDPRDAVVLGMLHSSSKRAPITAKDVNHEKGFTTRSKMHLAFNDDTKTIKIDTPAGNSITLDEQGLKIEIKDQNSNKLTMDTSGIKLESPLNIDIKAGAILTLAAGASLSVSAPALSIKADASVGIEGATMKLASQGPNIISGLPVMIN